MKQPMGRLVEAPGIPGRVYVIQKAAIWPPLLFLMSVNFAKMLNTSHIFRLRGQVLKYKFFLLPYALWPARYA